MKTNKYRNKVKFCMLMLSVRSLLCLRSLFMLLMLTVSIFQVKSQENFIEKAIVNPLVYDEISVYVIVAGYNNFSLDALYTDDDLLYINVGDLFKTLLIPCAAGQNGNSLSGFIEEENQTYLIDYHSKQIKVGEKILNTKNGLIKEMGTIYLESSLFNEIFGITLTFNFRTLSAILKSDFDLPVIKLQRIEKMRSNMSKIKGEIIADTVLQRNYHLFQVGTLDWMVGSSQSVNGGVTNNFGLSIGTELLFGEADFSINYYDREKHDEYYLSYHWRWVDNEKSIIKQAQIGTIFSQTISYIGAPVIGAVIRNSPTTVRKATGYYNINDFTEPNWTVELYINNVLVDYTIADASGLYLFKVPVVYGYTTLKLRFYGTLGEERTEERTINIPYTVMPDKELEYSFSAGIVQDSSLSRFGKVEFNYGINRFLTLGGGIEYLTSIYNRPFVPHVKATMQPFSKLTFSIEYAHGIKTSGLLNYYLGKDVLLEIDYAKYVEGQLATRFNAPEERKVKLSLPLPFKKINSFARFDYTNYVFSTSNYHQANTIISFNYLQFSANSSSHLNWGNKRTTGIVSDLALSYRMNYGYTLRSMTQYSISDDKFINYRVALEKNFSKGNLSISYDRHILANENRININFKYDLSFARATVSASSSQGNVHFSESAQGSLALGGGNSYVHADNNTSVSKGGIVLHPFLDLNNNGVFDKDEPRVKLNSVRISGGTAVYSKKDSMIRIPNLNPFTSYILEFSDSDLDNIAWRFKNKKYQVLIDPNQFKNIDIPVEVVGEVSGMTFINNDNSTKGIGRILVKFYKKNSNVTVTETISESDGYIYYLGLKHGDYVARIDPDQLKILNMISSPESISFHISQSVDGGIVSGLEFTLSNNEE